MDNKSGREKFKLKTFEENKIVNFLFTFESVF